MNVTCNDCDRILEDGTLVEWAALELHANDCAACAEELRAWKAVSVATQELRNYEMSPALWPRIERALVEQAEDQARYAGRWSWLRFRGSFPMVWQTIAACAMVLLMVGSTAWFYRQTTKTKPNAGNELLKSKALKEVERTESAYVQAIDKLAAETKPQLENPATPLLSSYKEKLLMLDGAIEDLRAQEGENSSNAHLRYQLLAMYQEKQSTLEEVLEEKR